MLDHALLDRVRALVQTVRLAHEDAEGYIAEIQDPNVANAARKLLDDAD